MSWDQPKKGKKVVAHKTLHDGLTALKLGMTLRSKNLDEHDDMDRRK